jgi:uncharacterized protein YgiM (DUF1202 family)
MKKADKARLVELVKYLNTCGYMSGRACYMSDDEVTGIERADKIEFWRREAEVTQEAIFNIIK